jgi:hypothetical protein
MQPFDYQGSIVNRSQPTKVLRKLTKTITIDSVDRDPNIFLRTVGGATSSDAGDFVVYLPRVYENITKIKLKNAIIQAPVILTSATTIGFNPADTYILLGIEGMNRKDETAPGADRSGFVDSWFAKIPNDYGFPLSGTKISGGSTTGGVTTYVTTLTHGFYVGQTICVTGTGNSFHNVAFVQITDVPTLTSFTVNSTAAANGASSSAGTAFIPGILYYNDSTYDEQSVEFSPPIGRLQRMHLTLRRHMPPSNISISNPVGAPIVFGAAQVNFTFEIEYLDNGFNEFSSFETRLGPSSQSAT